MPRKKICQGENRQPLDVFIGEVEQFDLFPILRDDRNACGDERLTEVQRIEIRLGLPVADGARDRKGFAASASARDHVVSARAGVVEKRLVFLVKFK